MLLLGSVVPTDYLQAFPEVHNYACSKTVLSKQLRFCSLYETISLIQVKRNGYFYLDFSTEKEQCERLTDIYKNG